MSRYQDILTIMIIQDRMRLDNFEPLRNAAFNRTATDKWTSEYRSCWSCFLASNRKLQSVRLKGDRKFHDHIVKELFENPGSLNIRGLNSDTVIWKSCEYHYMHGRNHQSAGKYEVFPGPDLVFFYVANSFHFLVMEVKGNLLGNSYLSAEDQLNRAESYFKGFWRRVIVNQAKPALLTRFREFPYTDVFLSLAEVTGNGPGVEHFVFPYRNARLLGKVRGSRRTFRVFFTE